MFFEINEISTCLEVRVFLAGKKINFIFLYSSQQFRVFWQKKINFLYSSHKHFHFFMSDIKHPIRLDLIGAFKKQYKQFLDKQNLAFKLAPMQGFSESTVEFMLRLTRWYEPQKRNGSDINQVFEEARSAGRSCMSIVFHDPNFIRGCWQYLLDQGYFELMNVYLFTAPLDALSQKIMYAPRYNDVSFCDWRDVIGLNETPNNIHSKFIKEYIRIWNMWAYNEITHNPFSTDDNADIHNAIICFQTPRSKWKISELCSYFKN